MLRAGLTDVLVTGMPTRWISVSPSPMAIGAKPAGALPCVAPMMMNRNIIVSTTSASEAGDQAVLARRVLAVAVGREALGEVEARRAAGDQRTAPRRAIDRADHLRDDIGADVLRREAPAGGKPDRHGRVEVAARDVADGVGHRQHRQAEGERDAEEPDADLGKGAAITALPQPAKVSQNVPMASAAHLRMSMVLLRSAGAESQKPCVRAELVSFQQ